MTTYQNNVRQIYRWFNEARLYGETWDKMTANGAQPPVGFHRNLRYEAMVPAVRGQMPIMVDANTVAQMRDVIRFMDSLKVKVIIRGASEGCHRGPPHFPLGTVRDDADGYSHVDLGEFPPLLRAGRRGDGHRARKPYQDSPAT